jgi:hypothetical protein
MRDSGIKRQRLDPGRGKGDGGRTARRAAGAARALAPYRIRDSRARQPKAVGAVAVEIERP